MTCGGQQYAVAACSLPQREEDELARLRGEMMADYKHSRRGCTDDGGDICAGLTAKIWLRNNQYNVLFFICCLSIKTGPN